MPVTLSEEKKKRVIVKDMRNIVNSNREGNINFQPQEKNNRDNSDT